MSIEGFENLDELGWTNHDFVHKSQADLPSFVFLNNLMREIKESISTSSMKEKQTFLFHKITFYSGNKYSPFI